MISQLLACWTVNSDSLWFVFHVGRNFFVVVTGAFEIHAVQVWRVEIKIFQANHLLKIKWEIDWLVSLDKIAKKIASTLWVSLHKTLYFIVYKVFLTVFEVSLEKNTDRKHKAYKREQKRKRKVQFIHRHSQASIPNLAFLSHYVIMDYCIRLCIRKNIWNPKQQLAPFITRQGTLIIRL